MEFEASKQELEIFHTPIFQQIIADICRFNKKPNGKKRPPITQLVLRVILTRLNKNT